MKKRARACLDREFCGCLRCNIYTTFIVLNMAEIIGIDHAKNCQRGGANDSYVKLWDDHDVIVCI